MPRVPLGRMSRLATLLLAAVLGLALAAIASADTPPGRVPTPTPTPPAGDCAVLHVQLNGTQPPTRTCLAQVPDAQRTGPSAQAPITAVAACYADSLHIFEHTNYGGRSLCVTGTGILHLEDHFWTQYWPYPWPRTWNDRMSSFKTGQYYVNFYEHDDFGGERLRYASYQSRASMPSGWDNRVSSVCIWITGNTCP